MEEKLEESKDIHACFCSKCNQQISYEDYCNVFGGEYALNKLLVKFQHDSPDNHSNSDEDQAGPKQIDCLICYDVHPIEDIVSLECDHMFGRECMAEFLKSKIIDN